MILHVSVDFGTSSTATAVSVDGSEPQVIVFDGRPLVPSAVFAGTDGTLFIGQEAERHAAVDPSRFEPHPKRRIDEGELLLGSMVVPVSEAVRAVLHRAVGEARRYAGGAVVDSLVLTHPADWGASRARHLRHAAKGLANQVVLVPEPVAAAVFHSARIDSGAALAVFDLGGGTVDASVVCARGGSFRVLATRGDPNFGGADIDQTLLDHVGRLVGRTDLAAWRQLVEGRELTARRRRRILAQDLRGAKETLSRHAYTDVPMPAPFSDAHLTRADLEQLVAASLAKAVNLVFKALRESGVRREELAAVFLVGGSSRIPMVGRLLHERIGIVPTTLDQPETVVARGALRSLRAGPGRAPVSRGASSQRAARSRFSEPPVENDSLSKASTVVIGGSDLTRPVLSRSGRARGRTRGKAEKGRNRRSRMSWWVACGAGMLVVAVIGAAMISTGESDEARAGSRHAAQYDYAFNYPADWHQVGGNPRYWQTVVSPREAVPGTDLIAVQQGKLDYDTEIQHDRAVSEIRAEYDQQRSGGQFSDFDPAVEFAGRELVHYREHLPNRSVDWYAIHTGRSRVSVGCQYTPRGRVEVLRACEHVIRSLAVR